MVFNNEEYIKKLKIQENNIRAKMTYNSWKHTAHDYCVNELKRKYGDDENNEKIWNIIRENYIEELIDGEYDGNYVKIIDMDGEKYSEYFRESCGNEWFTVLDISLLGEQIGREICDELIEKNISINNITESNGNYTTEFFGKVLTKIEEDITKEIRNDICHCVFRYLDNNLE